MKEAASRMSSSVFGVRSGRIQGNASLRHALGEAGILRGGSLHHQVDSAAEECFQILLEAEVAVEECGRVSPLEGDYEVQVAALGIEPFVRRRAEQVEALDAVAATDLPYLLNPVLDDRNHGFTLPQTAHFQHTFSLAWRLIHSATRLSRRELLTLLLDAHVWRYNEFVPHVLTPIKGVARGASVLAWVLLTIILAACDSAESSGSDDKPRSEYASERERLL